MFNSAHPWVKGLGIGFFLILSIYAILLYIFQRRLIYLPHAYHVAPEALLSQHLEEGRAAILEFTVRGTRQRAYLLRPRGNPKADVHLWVFFGGNASLALDWLDYAELILPCTSGVLLVEYPGYGLNEGRPTRETIVATAVAAFEKAARFFNESPRDLAKRTSLLGISLGCAVALELATRYEVSRVFLLAPFSSLLDMARRSVGWPLCYLLRDRFDNVSTLRALARRTPPPKVWLFHGDADDIVPVAMSRHMAAESSSIITYTEIPGADHASVLDLAFPSIREAACKANAFTSAQIFADRRASQPIPE
ncbi:MAG: alpha/beta fold hydrolase [Candidatus Sumerlaeaceae bacterium]